MRNPLNVLKLCSFILVASFLHNAAFASELRCSNILESVSSEHLKSQNKFKTFMDRYPGKLKSLPESLSQVLYTSLRDHPVASLDQLPVYDPQGLIGFCFGRSFAEFLLSRRIGLEIPAIRNLFIIGDLRSGVDPEWRFHVTSVIRLSDGQWYAFDPIIPQNKPVPVAEWIKTVKYIWDKQGKAKLYVTSPFQIIPDIRKMAAPDQEKGTDIIDLSFDPKAKSDIQVSQYFGASLDDVTYYEVPDTAPYFLKVNPEGTSQFTFDQLNINGMAISFNNYFSNLFDSLLAPTIPPSKSMRTFSLSITPEFMKRPTNYGMLFNEDFWRRMQEAKSSQGLRP